MKNGALRVPITCPECSRELLAEFPTAAIAVALATGDTIRLFASCHDKAWNASFVEREQLRQYLYASSLESKASGEAKANITDAAMHELR